MFQNYSPTDICISSNANPRAGCLPGDSLPLRAAYRTSKNLPAPDRIACQNTHLRNGEYGTTLVASGRHSEQMEGEIGTRKWSDWVVGLQAHSTSNPEQRRRHQAWLLLSALVHGAHQRRVGPAKDKHWVLRHIPCPRASGTREGYSSIEVAVGKR